MLETDFKTEKLHKENYVLKLMHKAISEHSQWHEHSSQIAFKVYNKPIIYIYIYIWLGLRNGNLEIVVFKAKKIHII